VRATHLISVKDLYQNLSSLSAGSQPTGRAVGVAGWGSLSRFHPKIGYRFSVEDSIYVTLAWRGRGVGKLLLPPLIEATRPLGMHAVLVGIDLESEASIRPYVRFGFREVAHFSEVGNKFGRWLDAILMKLLLAPKGTREAAALWRMDETHWEERLPSARTDMD
jgi:RimJ/RimL family protein N-acetyltransferase